MSNDKHALLEHEAYQLHIVITLGDLHGGCDPRIMAIHSQKVVECLVEVYGADRVTQWLPGAHTDDEIP